MGTVWIVVLTAVIASMVGASVGALLTAVLIAAGRAQQAADVPCPRCPPPLDLGPLDPTHGFWDRRLPDRGGHQQPVRADGDRTEPSPTT